jgi:4-amino-4-deoxy-L-arabinose transferase-like glycosyltransferase
MRVVEAFLLGVVLVLALAWPLRTPPVSRHGEAREGLVVQDIVRHGHWILPRRNGELPSKPPLFHWIAAAGARVLGLSDATLRLPSALAAWVMAVATLLVGAAAGGGRVGWLAVGALLGMVPFLEAATEARVDMVFSACVVVAIVAFWFWYRDRRAWTRVLVYAAAAGAVLAKGPAGGVLPGLVIVVFLARERDLRALRALWSWPLVGASAGVDLGWYLLAYGRGGEEFLALQIVRENLHRFVGGPDFARSGHGASSRLAVALLTQLLPWSLALPWAAWCWTRGEREDTLGRLLHGWWLTVLVFFTVAAGKRTIYLLPAYPAIAVLAGRALARLAGILEARPALVAARRVVRPLATTRRLALAIALFDLVALGILQGTREERAARKSLVPFTAAVRARLGPDAPLEADPALRGSDLQVAAYRLDRPIPRRHGPERAGVYYLVPSARVGQRDGARYNVIVASQREGDDVALVRATGEAPDRHGDEGG